MKAQVKSSGFELYCACCDYSAFEAYYDESLGVPVGDFELNPGPGLGRDATLLFCATCRAEGHHEVDCPICGEPAVYVVDADEENGWRIECDHCGHPYGERK